MQELSDRRAQRRFCLSLRGAGNDRSPCPCGGAGPERLVGRSSDGALCSGGHSLLLIGTGIGYGYIERIASDPSYKKAGSWLRRILAW